MRYASKVDKNQAELIKVFQQLGCSVLNCSHVGKGFPDLVIGFRSENYTVEVKNPNTGYGKHGLNSNQEKWAESWSGSPVFIARTLDDVLRLVALWNEHPRPTAEQAAPFLK